MAPGKITITRTVPLGLITRSVIIWAQYVGNVAAELASEITELGEHRPGPVTWSPIAMTSEEIIYEFEMPYS